ncbi:MAG: hypothetical protein QY327_03410 [Fimbriimonadaceae bacterium]|uniref:Uncharacterized protein n=1 Tax=Candidatus Nitrosymbiomonas proteolyticus TaxID=2608984 RepID=A0A809RBA5_9BACT|nr:MAG: hypothetical protein UZ18_ATM001001769 [Armatimonadetes bacterium OLB18]MCK6632028.1 hypothetical protein [Fimbriimonadaceae bacterium]NUM38469.1 hypothetical protein [Armatimonadota bacterium]WKZ80951.1 MAG: hypothetical protein QY327_03410 [Fimbriimonadaceae bacterium]BBO24740.1 conserved hypothetical protein [Candidatus Nitrosymbiomonas proteolyticus]
MRNAKWNAWIGAVALFLGTTLGYSQTLNVTSPTNGQFLGQTNQLKFTVTNINVEVTMRAEITGPGGTTVISERFTPNADGKIDNNLPLNFSQAAPEGAYTISVTATRNDNNSVFGTAIINVTVDVTKPKFLQFNPINNAFVKGIVPIRVEVSEPFFKDYRVQINGQDIPNNTGTTLTNDAFQVNWDTAGILQDGPQTIAIRLRDEADNEVSRSINVTIDRVPPSVTIVHPRSNLIFRPRSNISVLVEITDVSTSSIDLTGVDVIARRLDGTYIARVARQTFLGGSGNTMRWAGRLRWTLQLPKEFKIVVNVMDKAGNVAITQEVLVRYQ